MVPSNPCGLTAGIVVGGQRTRKVTRLGMWELESEFEIHLKQSGNSDHCFFVASVNHQRPADPLPE
jgi:hypothetical protein